MAACVILPGDFDPSGITDSKKLTARAREVAYERITHGALAWALGMANAVEIDQINILRATHVSMARAIAALALPPDLLLIDGLPVPGLPCATQRALVGGDGLSVSIAAASIVAKVTRDRMMVEADKLYPEYGFAGHKGYGAKTHIAALLEHGPCPLHRRSFSPVAEAISRQFSME